MGKVTMMVLALLLVGAGEASAGERQHHLGVDAGGAMVKGEGALSFGFGGGAHYAYGFKDTWYVMGELGSSVVPLKFDSPGDTSSTKALFAWSAAAGVSYAFEVIEWVPYVGILAGGYLLHGKGAGDTVVAPGLQAALGLDYQLSRSFALGLAVRQHFMLTQMDTFPVYTTALLRAEYMWGW
jgi:hypothetical protein